MHSDRDFDEGTPKPWRARLEQGSLILEDLANPLKKDGTSSPPRAGTKRGCVWTTTGVVGLIFSIGLSENAVAAFAPGATRGLPGVSPFGGSMMKDPDSRTGKKEGDLRVFERDVRSPTTRKLVHLAELSDETDNPRWRLSLVRALARHEHHLEDGDELRVDVLRALIGLFEASAGTVRDELGASLDPGAERHLVRGTAAMALVRSRHPLALKKLLAVALTDDQTDPVGTKFALEAIRSIPPDVFRAEDFSRLFTAEAIERVVRREPATPEFDLHDLTVSDLVRLGTEGDPKAPSATTTDKENHRGYAPLLKRLLLLQTLPRPLSRVRAWQEAFEENPVWTLRTWAYLGERLEKPIIDWGNKKAFELVESTSKVERSAAAWCLSVVSPDDVTDLLERKDSVMTHAILRQASEGQVAALVIAELKRDTFSKEDQTLAWNMVLQAPTVWASLSTARLRDLEKNYSPAVLAALASRLRTTLRGLGPDAMAVQSWLHHKSKEVRSNAALGLAHADLAAARGLLYQGYRDETDPDVRRAIVFSIAQTSLGSKSAFVELLTLDPDPTSRQLIEAATETKRVGIFVGSSARTISKVSDREGRIFEVVPAPDGFTGIVRSSF